MTDTLARAEDECLEAQSLASAKAETVSALQTTCQSETQLNEELQRAYLDLEQVSATNKALLAKEREVAVELKLAYDEQGGMLEQKLGDARELMQASLTRVAEQVGFCFCI